MFIERSISFLTPVLKQLRTVVIGPARTGGSPTRVAASFQRKNQGRIRRRDDILDNNGVKSTLDTEEFHTMAQCSCRTSRSCSQTADCHRPYTSPTRLNMRRPQVSCLCRTRQPTDLRHQETADRMMLSQGIIGQPFKRRMVSPRDDDCRQLLGHIQTPRFSIAYSCTARTHLNYASSRLRSVYSPSAFSWFR